MFPINFNFPYRKKDGSLITMEKALDGAGSDLDLIDLDDVSITSPADGDGLIYDNTAHKWKNIPIISRIVALFNAWKNGGAFNSLPNNGVTQTAYGLTFTFNPSGYKRGIVHVSGTKSDAGGHAVDMGNSLDTRVFTLKAGTYKILDGVSVSNTNLGLELYNYTSDTLIKRTLNTHAEIFTLTEDTLCVCSIGYKGAIDTVFDDYIYPMITTDLNATPADYEPFAKTNGELTEDTRKIVTIIDTMPATATNKPVGGCPVGYVLIGADVYNASDNRWDSMPVGVFPDRPCYITSYSDSTTTYARPYLESGGVTAYGGQTFRAQFMRVN